MTTVQRAGWFVFTLCVVVFLIAPLLLLVLFSFGENRLTTFPMGGLTLSWYEKVIDWSSFWSAFENSAWVSGSVGAVSTITGTLFALFLLRMRARWAVPMLIAFSFPLMIPPLVIGFALLSSYTQVGFDLGLLSVIFAHLVITQPFVILVVYTRLLGFDFAMVDAARDCGARPVRIFFTVILPQIRNSVIGAALIAAALSLDDFIITFFTIGGGNTLSTLIWGMLRTTIDPGINVVGTFIILLTVGMTLVALWVTRYRG
ncbi:MAG: ABC transporter permease [Gammaproteobacteria bacterium]|nr:ABC transporter permease [Gammaproteobacteria bacterium]